ncbi:MAG: GFA family protein [Deltaproteobacteria bacterium]|nr:GFA family protein [Deltaproteobacteria bacterium]
MPQGSCLCGAVRYEARGPFSHMMHCHCSMCRKHHGSLYATFVGAPLEGFRWLSGEAEVAQYKSSPEGSRSFCGRCGSVAPMVLPEAGMVFLPAGSLEGDLGTRPEMHLFVGSKAPWYALTDELPRHDRGAPGMQMPDISRPVVAPQEGLHLGSCLCGRVAYALDQPPRGMLHCHCLRCRRARSAAHATNAYYPMESLRWLRGQDAVREYKVPEAKFFAVAFCADCGGAAPRISEPRGIAVVPTGTLDTDPGLRPQAHIFLAYKAPWDVVTDGLPQHPEALGS